MGVGPGVPVAICAERSTELMIAVLGVLKAGGAYAPLDPAYPAERISFMLDETAATVVLTQAGLRDRLPDHGARVLCLDADWGVVQQRSDENPEPLGTPDDLAYVLFTSGSTGRPKGVAMPHRVLTNLLAWQFAAWDPPSAAQTLQFASLSFDVAFQELFSTWASGGTLHLVDEVTRRDPAALLSAVDEQGIERIFLPFIALQHFAETSEYEELVPERVREVITAGEALQITPAVRRFFEATGARLHNQYGPTESHVVTQHTLAGPASSWPERPPIGRPIANARIRILDRFGALVPAGIPGELHIGGSVLADGYVNRADLTAERFVSDPFSGEPQARLYRTGDLVRYEPDGNVHYLGRSDTQVKLRGYRVELAEVEATLARHKQVREAVVAVVEVPGGERRLVAYLVGAPSVRLEPSELKTFLARTLPEFMIPSAFVVLDSLPLTATGKIDRKALSAINGRAGAAEDGLQPRDEIEERLAVIWQELLGIDGAIGIREDFFALGGHSLLAVRVFAEIEKALKVKLPLSLLFRDGTIEHLAAEVRARAERPTKWPCLVPLQTEGDRPPLLLMHGIDGELLFYRDFLRTLPPDQPVYALQPVGLDRHSYPHTRLEDMASGYATAIAEMLPEGPYLLCGYCFAGVLAYEVGHQLHQRGFPPTLLALIDSSPFGHMRTPRAQIERRKFHELVQSDLRGKRAWLAHRSRGALLKLRTKARWAAFDVLVRAHLPVPGFLWTMEAAGQRAMRRYVTPASPCRVTLFRSSETGGSFYNRSFWTKLAEGGVDVRPVTAVGIKHDNIIREPYVGALVAALMSCIDDALGEGDVETSAGRRHPEQVVLNGRVADVSSAHR
jgi:amino acid adenylation domain-containing protein